MEDSRSSDPKGQITKCTSYVKTNLREKGETPNKMEGELFFVFIRFNMRTKQVNYFIRIQMYLN
jgi:hypothetical protein